MTTRANIQANEKTDSRTVVDHQDISRASDVSGTEVAPRGLSGATEASDFEPRPRGRPKGSPDAKRVATQERIAKLADPLGFWLRVAKGRPVMVEAGRRGKPKVMHQPTLEHVFQAQERLLRKIIPDLKGLEMAGEGGGALVVKVVRFADHAPSE